MMKDLATMNLKFGLSVIGLLIGLGTGQAFAQNNPQETPLPPNRSRWRPKMVSAFRDLVRGCQQKSRFP